MHYNLGEQKTIYFLCNQKFGCLCNNENQNKVDKEDKGPMKYLIAAIKKNEMVQVLIPYGYHNYYKKASNDTQLVIIMITKFINYKICK